MEQNENSVELETPLKRGDATIAQVELIKPSAGSLRGVRLADLASSDVDALLTVLPRITLPALTKAECNSLDPVDLIALGGKVIGFFAVEVGSVDWPGGLTVNDLMADIAAIFHWPLSDMNDLPLAELLDWRHKALIRSGANTDE